MERPGSQDHPLRVAVIGSGPAGFYAVQALFAAPDRVIQVDMFERLPTPFGLVRLGVAPDHQKIKSVTRVYEKLARRPEFRFFGNVEYGKDVTLEHLRGLYHGIVFCTGAQTDRALGIPGEDLAGSHAATEFVAWYNGHPDYTECEFDLSAERAVVVGVGNVAVDVARILCRTPEELAATDIADYALEALRECRVREVFLLGRRGPAQAAFSNPEVKELGELPDAETSTLAEEMELDELSRRSVEESDDKATRRKLEILRSYIGQKLPERSRKLVLRFLVSPTEILDDGRGRVGAVRLERNELHAGDDGKLRSRGSGVHETIEAGLVFRSVGYRGVALPGLPFHEAWGIVPNDAGRVTDDGAALPGLYVAGWIKRGPSGVIGTNKPDAQETVRALLEDLDAGRHSRPASAEPAAVDRLLAERRISPVSYDDWCRIDALEVGRGEAQGRPRVKFTRLEEFRQALRG